MAQTLNESQRLERSRQLAELLLKKGAVLFRPEEPFTFASGIRSPIYCDNRRLLSNVNARREIIEGLVDLAAAYAPDQIAGVAMAGIPWGAWVAEKLGLPFIYVRSETKTHGTGQRVEGVPMTGGKTVLVEDLVTTGKSVLAAADILVTDAKVDLVGVISIFQYGLNVATRAFQERGVKLSSLVDFEILSGVAGGL